MDSSLSDHANLIRNCTRNIRQICRVGGLAVAIFFSNHLQAEPLGPQSTPLWLRYPAISPDGKNIAFSFEGHVFIVPSAGGVAQPLTAGSAHDTSPVWSPDGKLIAFASDRYGHSTRNTIGPGSVCFTKIKKVTKTFGANIIPPHLPMISGSSMLVPVIIPS
jgi:hypothetical protein